MKFTGMFLTLAKKMVLESIPFKMRVFDKNVLAYVLCML